MGISEEDVYNGHERQRGYDDALEGRRISALVQKEWPSILEFLTFDYLYGYFNGNLKLREKEGNPALRAKGYLEACSVGSPSLEDSEYKVGYRLGLLYKLSERCKAPS